MNPLLIMQPTRLPLDGSPTTNFKGPRGSLKHRCGLCLESKPKLSKCTGCQVVRYCSRDHQAQHRQEHKTICRIIKKHRTKLDKADCAVRHPPDTFENPANAFETDVGRFWVFDNTCVYLKARFGLADTVRRVGTLDGITEALDHMLDMLRLSRIDNMGIRNLIPPMFLQLDRDQECYDFIKWFEMDDQRCDYDWEDLDLPFLDLKGANVFEDIGYLKRAPGHVLHLSVMILMKLKLLVDIIHIKLTRKVIGTRLPVEIWQYVECHVVRSPISRKWVDKPFRTLLDAQDKLTADIMLLAKALWDANQDFIHVLTCAQEFLAAEPPRLYELGSQEEMEMLLQCSYGAWWQHEGVLDLLQAAKSIAGKNAGEDVENLIKNMESEWGPGTEANKSRQDFLDSVSDIRLWGYFSHAVQDATSLSKDRPSEIMTREMAGKPRMEWFGTDYKPYTDLCYCDSCCGHVHDEPDDDGYDDYNLD